MVSYLVAVFIQKLKMTMQRQQRGTLYGALLKTLAIVTAAKLHLVLPRGRSDKSKKLQKGKLQTISQTTSAKQSYSRHIRCRFTSLIPFYPWVINNQ